MIKGAIFDMDGTVLNSMWVWHDLGKRYLAKRGILAEEGLSEKLLRLSLDQGAKYLKERYALNCTEWQIADGINELVRRDYIQNVQLKRGAAELLKKLYSAGVKICAATATDEKLIDAALRRCGVRKYFDGIFTCTAVGHGKDEPDVFEIALAFLGTEKGETFIFEDALHAADTAKRAGFKVVGVYDASELFGDRLKTLAEYYTVDFSGLDGLFT